MADKTMKTQAEIEARMAEVDADPRYHYPPAIIETNAPLALIQTVLETQARTLAWVLGIDPPKQRRRGRA